MRYECASHDAAQPQHPQRSNLQLVFQYGSLLCWYFSSVPCIAAKCSHQGQFSSINLQRRCFSSPAGFPGSAIKCFSGHDETHLPHLRWEPCFGMKGSVPQGLQLQAVCFCSLSSHKCHPCSSSQWEGFAGSGFRPCKPARVNGSRLLQLGLSGCHAKIKYIRNAWIYSVFVLSRGAQHKGSGVEMAGNVSSRAQSQDCGCSESVLGCERRG